MAEADAHRGRLSFARKVAFGIGIMPNGFMINTMFVLAVPIFSIGMGVPAHWIGLALMLSKIWDAVTDPIVGNWSDNLRTRWGRRRPLILFGCTTGALLFFLLWSPPAALGQVGLLVWFLTFSILLNTAYTVYMVPYNGLAYELTEDYDERTRVMAYRGWFQAVASFCIGWIYKLSFTGTNESLQAGFRTLMGDGLGGWFASLFGSSEVQGVRVVAALVAALIVLTSLPVVLFVRERPLKAKLPPVRLLHSVRCTLSHRPFLLICGIVFFTLAGIYIVHPLSQFLSIYYLFDGDRDASGTLMGLASTAWVVSVLVCVPGVAWLAARLGKKTTLILALSLNLVSNALHWILYTPAAPMLAVLNQALMAPAVAAIWVLESSMVADITDIDEAATGERREAMFGAVLSWVFKGGTALALGLSGYVVAFTGVDAELLGPQAPETILRLRLLFTFLPVALMTIALLLALRYPLRREDVTAARRALSQRPSNA